MYQRKLAEEDPTSPTGSNSTAATTTAILFPRRQQQQQQQRTTTINRNRSTTERERKKLILALANYNANANTNHNNYCQRIMMGSNCNKPQLVVVCLGLAIALWGVIGTWMILEVHRDNNTATANANTANTNAILRLHRNKNKNNSNDNQHYEHQRRIRHGHGHGNRHGHHHRHRHRHTTTSIFDAVSENAPICHDLESPDDITLTLVTQVSHDRLWMMEHHCDRYRYRYRGGAESNVDADTDTDADADANDQQQQQQHRMSIAVYSNATRETILDELTDLGCGVIRSAHGNDNDNASVEAGVEVSVLDARTHGAWNDYPVNELRNLALSKVRTTHILYIDVDFWPSEGLYETLLGSGEDETENNENNEEEPAPNSVRGALFADPKQALVIPAFQLWRQCAEWTDCREENLPHMERTRTLMGFVEEIQTYKSIAVFDPTNKGGHGSTSYVDWPGQPPGSVLPISCLQSNRYEPFVVVRYCRDLPPFQTAFAGYGKNKVTWTMHLVAKGYVLGQVGGAFLMHYPHLDSTSRQHWNLSAGGSADAETKAEGDTRDASDASDASDGAANYDTHPLDSKRSEVDRRFVEFKHWLAETIPDTERRLGLCEDAQDDDGKLWVSKQSPKPKSTSTSTSTSKATSKKKKNTKKNGNGNGNKYTRRRRTRRPALGETVAA